MKGKKPIGSVQGKKNLNKSNSKEINYNNKKQRKIKQGYDKNDNDISNFFERKSRRLATKEIIGKLILFYLLYFF